MNGISILFVAASLFGLGGILSIPVHAIFAKMVGREPVRVLNWLVWIVSGTVLSVLMIGAGFLGQSWSWILGEIFFALIIAILVGEFSLIKSDYLVYSRKFVLKWWQVLVMDWNRSYALIFRIKKQKKQNNSVFSKIVNWVWGQIKPRLWWLTPLIIGIGMILIAPKWWIGYFITMVAISLVVLDKSSRTPWSVRYQSRKIPEIPIGLGPSAFPWRDPHKKITYLKDGVAVVSWVPHWSRTLKQPLFWYAFLVCAVALGLFIWTLWYALIMIAALGFLVPAFIVEFVRWNEIYTLADNQHIYRLARTWTNWFMEIETVIDLSKAIDVDENIRLTTGLFGDGAISIRLHADENPMVLDKLPWADTILESIQFAASRWGQSISLAYSLGLHHMSHLERVTEFQNKAGDIWRGAEISWDWMDPGLRNETVGYELNRDYPTGARAHRESLDAVKKPEKIWFLVQGIMIAWQAYDHNYAISRDKKLAHRTGSGAIRSLIKREGDKYEPALHSWEPGGLSPLSQNWDFYSSCLRTVWSKFGSFTTPGPGTWEGTGKKPW